MEQYQSERSADEQKSHLSTSSSLIRELKGFSPARWESFVLVYSPLIRFWIQRKGVHPQAVEDICQESLRTIFSGIDHFERNANHGSFRGWLRTIVHRRVVDHIRSNGHEHPAPQLVLDGIIQPDGRDPAEIEAEEQALHELKARAMELVRRSTAEKTWQMFWMSAVEEVPTAEIAARFGVTKDAVRVAKGRVLNRLREMMIHEIAGLE